MKTIFMPKAILQKWLDALRSGAYEQGAEYLCANNKYCCLGVLQHVCDGKVEKHDYGDNEENSYMLPSLAWLKSHGIRFFNGAGDDGDMQSPWLEALRNTADFANDRGIPFTEIADAIEQATEVVP